MHELKKIPLFSCLNKAYLDTIASHCREMSFRKGGVILHQDEKSFDLYCVLEGDISVSLINAGGREVTLDTLGPGDIFGELSFLDNRSRSAMVTALTPARILFLSHDAFRQIVRNNGEIALGLLQMITRRLRKANETIETLTFLDVSGRIAKLLVDAAQTEGEKLPGGFVRLNGFTHQKIANRIGASREAVTKAVKAMTEKKLISHESRSIVIAPGQFELW